MTAYVHFTFVHFTFVHLTLAEIRIFSSLLRAALLVEEPAWRP